MDRIQKKSNWIWTAGSYDESNPSLLYFRKELLLDKATLSAKIRLSADSRYRLYVNGTSVAQGPCKGDNHVWYYDETDIKEFLKPGVNVFAAIVLRYPQKHDKGNHSVWRTEMPGFYLSGSFTMEDGTELPFGSDESWKSFYMDHVHITKASGFFEPIYITEKASGDVRTFGWKQAGFSDKDWAETQAYSDYAVRKAISPGGMGPRPIPFLYEKEKLFDEALCKRTPESNIENWQKLIKYREAITVAPNTQEIIEISAGEEQTGFLELALAGGTNAKLSILCSEAYAYPPKEGEGFMRMPQKGNRMDFVNGQLSGSEDTYSVGGYGTAEQPEEYEPFWFRTFRFVKLTVETGDEPLTITKLSYRETGYPLEVKTEVKTSDDTLAGVWDISERTLRRCMHETYEDCPFYEQLQYVMDSRSQILYTYNTAADDRLARKCIDDFFRSQRYDGMVNSCYPSYGPNVIPGFSIYYILMIHDHMMYFGDKKLVEKYMPSVERVLQFFDNRLDDNGLTVRTSEGGMGNPYWSFVDWVNQWKVGVPNAIFHGSVTMDSLLYRMGLQTAAALANYIGLPDRAAMYLKKAEAIKQAILAKCVGRDGLIQDGPEFEEYSQHAQVFAVLTDVVTGSKAKEIMEIALTDGSLAQCSVAMAFYLFRAVEKTGLYDKTSRLWDPWRIMVDNKLTTCVESDGLNGRSDCHAWGSLALYELPAVILGVQPAEPGYKSISVKPNPGYLGWAKGKVITPNGMVAVSWEKGENGKLNLHVDAPDGVTIVKCVTTG